MHTVPTTHIANYFSSFGFLPSSLARSLAVLISIYYTDFWSYFRFICGGCCYCRRHPDLVSLPPNGCKEIHRYDSAYLIFYCGALRLASPYKNQIPHIQQSQNLFVDKIFRPDWHKSNRFGYLSLNFSLHSEQHIKTISNRLELNQIEIYKWK